MEELVKECGFESICEFNSLVGSVDLSDAWNASDFKKWKEEDGSKEGLLKLKFTLPNAWNCRSLS